MEDKGLQELSEEVEVVGVHTLCRLCASQNERLIGIYSDEGISNDLATKINAYLPMKVSVGDDLPLQCCWNCASTILAWHELVLISVETDRKFRTSQIIAEKHIIDDVGYDVGPNPPSDNEGIDAEPITTSLNDFCQTPTVPLLSKKLTKRRKKKKKPDVVQCYQPDACNLETYITDIEHELIDSGLVDNPEYKLDIHSEEILDDAKTEVKDEYYACQHCPEIFVHKEDIGEHVVNDHGKEYTKEETECKKDKRKNNKIDQEVINKAKVVVDGRIYYNCKECGKSLHSPYTYIWHMRIHTGERPYVCDLCGKQFRVSQGLVRHLRETHEGIKKFPCDLCGRMFATRRNVEEHRRIHTNERPYVCDLCGKSFKQKASLFVHKRSHKNYFPFKCSYCSQGFRTKPPLMVHITRHTGEKPYKCDVCGRCFRIKYELKRHRLIHSDEKPWVCNICGFSFRQKRYLRNHTKSNHTLVDG